MAADDDSKKPKGEYAVGYGKPPHKNQFKPGRSGNPKGRPKGLRNFTTDARAMLKSKVPYTGPDGRRKTISAQEASFVRLKEMALRGDARGLDRLLGIAMQVNPGTAEDPAADAPLSPGDQEIVQREIDALVDAELAKLGVSRLKPEKTGGEETKPDKDDVSK
jgi:hypothetical protein